MVTVYRVGILENTINKGIAIDEKTNVSIPDWSPNNVRRLIIGVDKALVQYFVVYGKYKKIFDFVDYSGVVAKDLECVLNPRGRYTSILKALVNGRICSSVEEIIICAEEYPKNMLELDIDYGALVGGNYHDTDEKMRNRFVRLKHIAVVNNSLDVVLDVIRSADKTNNSLMLDVIRGAGKSCKIVYSGHENWWSGTFLRGNIYGMDADGGVLEKYFSRIKSDAEVVDRAKRLDALELKEFSELVDKNYDMLNTMLVGVLDTVNKMREVVEKSSVVDRVQWANTLGMGNVARVVEDTLFSSDDESLRDFSSEVSIHSIGTLVKVLKDKDITANSIWGLSLLLGKLQDVSSIQLHGDKRPKHVFKSLIDLAACFIFVQNNIAFHALCKCLLKSGPKYVAFHKSRMRFNGGIIYSRDTSAYLKSVLPDGVYETCLSDIGALNVPVAEYDIQEMLDMTKLIVGALKGYDYRDGGVESGK